MQGLFFKVAKNKFLGLCHIARMGRLQQWKGSCNRQLSVGKPEVKWFTDPCALAPHTDSVNSKNDTVARPALSTFPQWASRDTSEHLREDVSPKMNFELQLHWNITPDCKVQKVCGQECRLIVYRLANKPIHVL